VYNQIKIKSMLLYFDNAVYRVGEVVVLG
jgi:hypothetical protein